MAPPPADRGGRGRFWRRAGGGAGATEGIFRLLFDAAPDGMALLDAEGRILLANPALDRMAGPVTVPRRGLAVAELLAPAGRAALNAALQAALAGRREGPPVLAAPADPAAPAEAEWALRCHALPGGAQRGAPALLLHVTDRTEQRRAAARLAAMTRLETVGRLAGGIAHDFNNLLGAILGAAEALRAAGRLGPAAAEELATIEDAARRGAALVSQLLAFARQQHLRPRVLDLNEAVRGIAPLLRRLLGARVRLELALEEPGRRVRVDPGQLDQVLLNLAANAREAMPEGGTLRIATGHAVVLREGEGQAGLPPGRYAVLEVADTGDGIPPEALPRIFEPFFTSRPERGGTGLGLATVQGIVAQSGGHVGVVSRVGEGTTFRIHLPRYEGGEAAAEPAAPAPALAAPAGGPARILLVEDEAPLRRLAERVLQRAGHAVTAAESAEAALAALDGQAAPPALLVSDVAMPGTDGLTLARRLRARWPGLPVLLMSGYAEVTLGQDLEAEGIRLLPKPFTPPELLAAVAKALRPAAGAAPEPAVVY